MRAPSIYTIAARVMPCRAGYRAVRDTVPCGIPCHVGYRAASGTIVCQVGAREWRTADLLAPPQLDLKQHGLTAHVRRGGDCVRRRDAATLRRGATLRCGAV